MLTPHLLQGTYQEDCSVTIQSKQGLNMSTFCICSLMPNSWLHLLQVTCQQAILKIYIPPCRLGGRVWAGLNHSGTLASAASLEVPLESEVATADEAAAGLSGTCLQCKASLVSYPSPQLEIH